MNRLRRVSCSTDTPFFFAVVALLLAQTVFSEAKALNADGASCTISNTSGANQLNVADGRGTLIGAHGVSPLRLSGQGLIAGGVSLSFQYSDQYSGKDLEKAPAETSADLVAVLLTPQKDVLTGRSIAVGTVFVSPSIKPGVALPKSDEKEQYLLPLGTAPQSLPEGFLPWGVAECKFK